MLSMSWGSSNRLMRRGVGLTCVFGGSSWLGAIEGKKENTVLLVTPRCLPLQPSS